MQMPSMRQQLLIDRDRGLALGAFLDKVVRDASAKRNVPTLVGATLGTSLQDIDVDALLRAIERSGSTGESFDKPGAWADLSQEAEDRRRLKRRELYHDYYLAEQKRQDEARASAIPGRDPGLIDEFRRMGGQMETPVGPALPGGPGMMTPVGPVERPAAEAMPEQKTGPVFRGVRPDLLRHLQSIRVPQATATEGTDYRLGGAQDTGNIYRQVPYRTEGNWRRGGVEMPFRTDRERITEEELLEELGEERARQIREQDAFPDAVVQRSEPQELAEMRPSKMQAEGIRGYRTAGIGGLPGGVVEQQKGMDSQLAGVDLEGMAPESPSFLSRLGSGIKDNPEVALQIAALLGGVGSGLMGRGRLAKQQAEQDAANRQAAAYSNAISTLTRGRTTPAMAPRQVRSTPGTAETIMDVLGTLGQGGAQIAAAHRQRSQAEEDRQFARGIKTRELDIKEYEIEQRSADVAAAAAAKNIIDKATGGITPKQAQVIRAGLDNLQAIFDSGGPFETGTLSFDRTYGESAAIQNDFESSRNTLIAEIKDLMGLDRLTDRDLLLVIDTLPQRNDSAGAIRGTIRGIKNTLSRLESIYSGGAGGGGGAGQTSANTNLGAMSDSQLYQYAQQNRNDPAVEAELNRRLGN